MPKNDSTVFPIAAGLTSGAVFSDPAETQQLSFQERFIRRPEVIHLTSIPSSSITDLINRGDFPAPYKLSERMAAWKLSEVSEWMNSRKKAV